MSDFASLILAIPASATRRRGTLDKLAYSLREATEVTGIGKTKLYELIKDGKLRVTRIGGRTIIPAEALIKLVNTGRG